MVKKAILAGLMFFVVILPSFGHFVSNKEFIVREFPVISRDSSCSEIILRSGEMIEAIVKKITPEVIEYVKCGQSAPIYTVKKRDVLMIKYPDGAVEKFDISKSNSGKTGGIIAFSLSIVGIFLFSLFFGAISFIWGLVSLNKMSKSGANGKGFAIAAMIIGGLEILVMLIYLAAI